MATELPELLVPDAASWRAWLDEHHADSPGVRLVLRKKGGDVAAPDYGEAVDEALCFGWIDGQLGTRDAGSYRLRFTPRRAASAWSARNVERVARLTEAGRMRAAGLAAVDAARADGRWGAAYAGAASAEPPPAFLAALEASPPAKEAYARLNAANRYAVYYRLQSVRREETRERKIVEFVAMLARGEAPYAQPGFSEAPKRGSRRGPAAGGEPAGSGA
ncbi:YdeI/OmpD-associated family protein [Arthrobacter halodurans]|uniref:YdeI family protein n=1 Tax=Arthrobacter halodurans TaxID=516699 RepID=A0ABV4URV7_9MICC